MVKYYSTPHRVTGKREVMRYEVGDAVRFKIKTPGLCPVAGQYTTPVCVEEGELGTVIQARGNSIWQQSLDIALDLPNDVGETRVVRVSVIRLSHIGYHEREHIIIDVTEMMEHVSGST